MHDIPQRVKQNIVPMSRTPKLGVTFAATAIAVPLTSDIAFNE